MIIISEHMIEQLSVKVDVNKMRLFGALKQGSPAFMHGK